VTWPLYQVDAFCAEPFAGNPAAVCLLEGDEDAGWMQAVAAEMNLSETAAGPGTAAPGPEPGSGGYDFVSRYFAPAAGIDEDPVTGSAHCTLGPFWAERLGRDQLTGFQASPRGGLVRVRPAGDRVLLGGRAVTVVRGQLL
jgi:predicted PhzF superfamily epimerase YddE/YHI9